jgi:hypothetical protein
MSGLLANELLETQDRQGEEFERAADALQELPRRKLGGLIGGPSHPAHFGDGGEAIVHLGEVAIGFPRPRSPKYRRLDQGPLDAWLAAMQQVGQAGRCGSDGSKYSLRTVH